jgi:hypothetical protein
MYDNVKLYLDHSTGAKDCAAVKTIVSALDNARDCGVCISGFVENLTVKVYPANVIIFGSLPKFLQGDNIGRFDRHATRYAIEKLSDTLQTDINGAKVTGFEFGAVYLMDKPVNEYLTRFDDLPNMFKYGVKGQSVYYQTPGKHPAKKLIFYDKSAENANANRNTPPGLNNTNLLRYELRLERRLPQLLKENQITAKMLYSCRLYDKVLERYKHEYFMIPKKRILVETSREAKITVSDAYNRLVAKFLADNQVIVTNYVEALKQQKQFKTRTEYTRLRNKFKGIVQKYSSGVDPEDIIEELDDEIRNVGL